MAPRYAGQSSRRFLEYTSTRTRADIPPGQRRHWPIGLLYDYHSHKSPSTSTGNGRSSHVELDGGATAPFAITLHFTNAPQDALLMGPSMEACKGTFMHMLKVSLGGWSSRVGREALGGSGGGALADSAPALRHCRRPTLCGGAAPSA